MQLPKFLSSSAGRTLFISLTFWLLLFTYCRLHFWRDIHTSFFQFKIAYDFKYTLIRHQQAQDHLRNLKTQSSHVTKGSSHPDICVAVVTVKRQGEQYIGAALGSLLQGLNGYERKQLHLMVLLLIQIQPFIRHGINRGWRRLQIGLALTTSAMKSVLNYASGWSKVLNAAFSRKKPCELLLSASFGFYDFP
jgi:hypothetical protein